MNTTTNPFPAPAPALKLPRRSIAPDSVPENEYVPSPAEVEQRRQLEADIAELREREANLREYEARLRAWQDQLDADVVLPKSTPVRATTTGANFAASGDLQAAWEKFHRAHALLEAEQRQMRIDRIVSQENEAAVQRREAELTAREATIAERERVLEEMLAGAAAAAQAEDAKPRSTMQRLTQAPFMSVFKGAK